MQRILARYSKYDLLILYELGYISFTKEGSEFLFQILAFRYEKKSTIITSNLGFGDWTQVFEDRILATELLDRLTYNAHIINCTCIGLSKACKNRKTIIEGVEVMLKFVKIELAQWVLFRLL